MSKHYAIIIWIKNLIFLIQALKRRTCFGLTPAVQSHGTILNKIYTILTQNRYIFLFLFSIAIFFVGTPANAQTSRLYFAGYLGLNTSNDQYFSESSSSTSGDIEMKNTLLYAGALGIRLSRQFRLEGELSYRKTDMDRITFSDGGDFELGGELRTWLALANLYYDFDVNWKNIQPFVGIGLGFGWHNGEVYDLSGLAANVSEDSNGIAWQVGGGFKYRVNPDLAFTSAYRYIDSTDLTFKSYDWDYGSHEFLIGLEYDLPIR